MKRSIFLFAASAGAIFLAGCSAKETYRHAPTTGRFSGEPRMVAIAPNTFFFFQPNKDKPFTFTTHRKDDPALDAKGGRGKYRWDNWTIRPEEMITNGASVPRQVWYLPGFAAFDFTRAALIHDWLYEAHHRYAMAEAAYDAARKRGDRAAMTRSDQDRKAYLEYAKVTQNDAADIFAECIKAAMIQSGDMAAEFKRLEKPGQPVPSNLAALRDAFHYNRPHPPTLWAYHYFVSEDCGIGTSRKVWEDHSSDVDLYRALSSPEIASRVVKRGYISRWMIHRFQDILKKEEERHRDYQEAVKQGIRATPEFVRVKAEGAPAPAAAAAAAAKRVGR